MTAETETTFPLHPVAEETLAANPDSTYLWDLTKPVRPATPDEVTEYGHRHTDPAWHGLYRFAGYTGHAEMAAAPVAEVVPEITGTTTVTETGHEEHEDTAAAPEGDAAAGDLSRPGQDAPGGASPGITGPGRPDLPGRPTVSAAEGAKPVNALPGEPDHTALIPVADDFTQVIEPVTDSTEGSEPS